MSVGESVRIVRELQGMSQNELARRAEIPQATMSAIENDRLGVERAKVLARVLKCHPGVLVFPGWVLPTEAAATSRWSRRVAGRSRVPRRPRARLHR